MRWFKKYKQTNSRKVHQKYLDIKKLCSQECRKAKAQFLDKLCQEENSKLFWKHIKSKRLDSSNNTYLKDKNGTLHDNDIIKAELFNEQFSSVYSPPEDKQVHFVDPPCLEPSPNIVVTTNGVLKQMQDLKPNKATGPDNIPPRLLIELAVELAPVFTLLFNASLSQGVVPADWRSAHVTPIFKKGDPLTPANYRPVSLTSIPCKILEHIVHSNVINHLIVKNKILCDQQHGFRKKRSCETQLISFINDLATNMDHEFQTDCIFLDFAKAFDKVNHLSLIKKMKHYGVNSG